MSSDIFQISLGIQYIHHYLGHYNTMEKTDFISIIAVYLLLLVNFVFLVYFWRYKEHGVSWRDKLLLKPFNEQHWTSLKKLKYYMKRVIVERFTSKINNQTVAFR